MTEIKPIPQKKIKEVIDSEHVVAECDVCKQTKPVTFTDIGRWSEDGPVDYIYVCNDCSKDEKIMEHLFA